MQLHGFNWFGFNDGTDALPLWSNEPLADFAHTVWRQKLLGFNAVRLPFSFAAFNKQPKQVAHACPDLSDDDIVRSTLGPNDQGVDVTKAPKLPAPPKRQPGQCNGYLEGNTVREQLIWTIKFMVNQGFYVLVDNHYREDRTAETDQRAWVQGWSDLAHALLSDTNLQGRVFFDLLNEPEQYGQMWQNTDKVGLKTLYLAAMDAIDQQSDKAIYFLEGTGHSALHSNWGDGYCVDDDKVRTLGLSDPRPFFSDLAGKPYKNRVVLAPHVYGPAVTYATADFKGAGLYGRLSSSFGQLTISGFEAAGQKLIFPVAIGEFGSHFVDDGDKAFLADFASYLKNDGEAKDGKHNPITSWFYWCWNCNSGDTGGLVKDDWTSLQWEKIAYLQGLGLTPWHKQGAGPSVAPAPAPGPGPGPGPGPAPAPAPAPASAPASDAKADAAAPITQLPPATAPAAPQPMPMPQPMQYEAGPSQPQPPVIAPDKASDAVKAVTPAAPAASAALDDKVHVRVGYNGEWDAGGTKHYVYNLHLTNGSAKPIQVPFEIVVLGPFFTELGETWNLSEAKTMAGAITAKVTADWATLPPSGHGDINVGFIATSKEQVGKLKAIKVAGQVAVLDE